MTPELTFTLNLAQIVLLGGLIWGLAQTTKSVKDLVKTSDALTLGLDRVTASLNNLSARVLVLEDRTGRR